MKNYLFAGLTLCLLLTGCQNRSTKEPIFIVEEKNAVVNSAANETEFKSVTINSSEEANDLLLDPNSLLSQRHIYFSFDRYVVKAEFQALLQAHATYLLTHTNAKIRLQGNTDMRGSHEYNLGLGQLRSAAVKQALNIIGVQDGQIETVSFGEEQADDACTTDACFKLDRRVDIVYQNQ